MARLLEYFSNAESKKSFKLYALLMAIHLYPVYATKLACRALVRLPVKCISLIDLVDLK